MGTTPSKPKPGCKVQVIGAGLMRTGTASFAEALSILLDGPVYHGGTQHILDKSESHILNAIAFLTRVPYNSPSDKTYVKTNLSNLLEGYVAVCDAPYAQFTPELLELYPDAKVICTTREIDSWVKSQDNLQEIGSNATGPLTSLVPVARLFPKFLPAFLGGRWTELYSNPDGTLKENEKLWQAHITWLRSIVPEGKLFFFDVREGWEPLCKALDVPVPKDITFPRVNDSETTKKIGRDFIWEGILRWALVVSAVVAVIAVGLRIWIYR